jgi:hypothetical protein
MREWKLFQELYHSLVTEHTDAGHLHKREMSDDKVTAALNYVREKADVGTYPGKSYIVAIIYATMINKVYGDDFLQTLNDPDLLYGQDDFFVPYSQDKQAYDSILEELKSIPNWIEGGWAPKTVEYFYLECTESGFDMVNSSYT